MHHKKLYAILAFSACAMASGAQAQFLDGLLKRAERAVKSEVETKLDRETRRVTRCVMGDERCIQAAERKGDTVEFLPTNQGGPSAPGQSAENAELPLIHLPLNGSVENLGTAGAASLYVPSGANQPFYIQGEEGQALSFGLGGAVTIPYEFDQQANPRATVTMLVLPDRVSFCPSNRNGGVRCKGGEGSAQ